MSIQPLPPEVVAQIKSSTAITTLNGVICELVKNSLDSEATKITIDVDYTRGGCVVEDDGLGIMPSEFAEIGGLGKLYHTSKIRSQTPLYGHHGSFLASLSAMALVFITSHHHRHRTHNSLTMHRSKVISRQIPSLAQHEISPPHGTKISVRDLFGAMPVRVKQRAIMAEKQGGRTKEWEELKRHIVLLLLSWNGNVAVNLRDNEAHQKMFIRTPGNSSNDTEEVFICSLLSQANLINSDQKESWVSINASTPKILLSGAISLDPSATKSVQFLSLGIHPLSSVDGQSMLHDEINRLFANSNFGNEEEVEQLDDKERSRRANDGRFKSDGYTNRELKGGRKGVDRWPKFYIRIEPKVSEGLTVNDILDQRGNHLNHVLELLQVMIHAFLIKYHFRPRAIRRQPSPRKGKSTSIKPIQNTVELQNANAAITSQPLRSCLKPPSSAPPLDLFGTNIKLPSFHSSFQVDNSFESRIRSGKPSFRPSSVVSCNANIVRPSSAPPPETPASISRPLTPLLSKEGKLLRRPFEDVIQVVTSKPIQSQQPSKGHVVSKTSDVMELWINPITIARSFINTRTGHTISERAASTPPDVGRLVNGSKRLTHPLVSILGSEGDTSQCWTDILKIWENPVFRPAELPIPQISFDGIRDQTKDLLHGRNHHCRQIEIDRAFKDCSSGLNGRISKDGLKSAKVISQVDNKFILISISCTVKSFGSESEMLVIVDQHAVDERIRIESLMEELCSPSKTFGSGIETTRMEKPITFDVPFDEVKLLQRYEYHFADWGIIYDVSKQPPKDKHPSKVTTAANMVVRSLPPLIQERCKQEPRLLIQLIRTELWKIHESRTPSTSNPSTGHPKKHWLERIHTCPQGIIDMLNSRACRSAIMFNDILTRKQCELLVRKLADCKFPFQCAHGRPSLVPLVDLDSLVRFDGGDGGYGDDGQRFGEAFKEWRGRLGS